MRDGQNLSPSAHSHELLGNTGVKGHGAIEVGLGGTHPQGNRSHLDDLGGVAAHHVAAQDPI